MDLSKRHFLQLLGAGATLAIAGAGSALTGAGNAMAEMVSKLKLSDAEWRKRLSPERYNILRKEGTERAFSSPLDQEKRAGQFHCAGCDLALFDSNTKFDSRTGWPSFFRPISGQDGFQAHLPAHRVSLRALRRPSGTYLQRWSQTHRQTLLQQRPGADLQAHLGLTTTRSTHY
jgi:hypothetical protein